jgi:ligand-binding SRPBCC domain-containing protein
VKIYQKKWESTVPAPLDQVWDFFSRPDNLARITPEKMGFEMLTDLDGRQMYPGMFVKHRVRPIAGIPLLWTSEITHIREGQYFIDEQRSGPYALWHHEHHFEADGTQATIMKDILHYAMPFGVVGRIAHILFVERMIAQIFSHRETVIHDLF